MLVYSLRSYIIVEVVDEELLYIFMTHILLSSITNNKFLPKNILGITRQHFKIFNSFA